MKDQEVFDLIDQESFKQALNLVGQLTRQFPSSIYFKILEQYTKFKQSPGKYDYASKLAPLIEPNISLPGDSKSLKLLHDFLMALNSPIPPLKPYQMAVNKYPSFELCDKWFDQAIEDLDFNYLNKASFQLSRYSKNSRANKFWNAVVLLTWYKCSSNTLEDKDIRLLPQLSYQMLSQLKPFRDEQEVVVFCHICGLLGDEKADEIIELILNHWGTNREDSLDLYLKDLLVDNLKNVERYEILYEVCKSLLVHLDDFKLLKDLILSGAKVQKSKEEIEAQFSNSRNGYLAHIELNLIYDGVITEPSLRRYLDKFHGKPCCAIDIGHYMEHIDRALISDIFDSYERDIVSDANRIKLLESTDVEEFTELFLKYQSTLNSKPKTDYSSCSFFILNVVRNLLQEQKMDLGKIVTAISILESYQEQDPYNYDTRIALIALYQNLGLTPIAYQHYSMLKVKNVQNDILDHLLYTRYSTLYPNRNHDFLKKSRIDEGECQIYQSLESIPRLLKIAFEKSSFTKIPGMFSFYDQLQRSIMRWLRISDHLKLLRLCNDKRGAHLKRLHSELLKLGFDKFGNWADNRDFALAGISGIPIEYMNVDANYVTLQLLQELILECIGLGTHDELVDKALETMTLSFSCFTVYETWTWKVYVELYQHVPDMTTEGLWSLINNVPDFSHERDWKLIHGYTTLLMTFKTLYNIKRIKDEPMKKLIKEKLCSLRTQCSSYFHAFAQDIEESQVDNQLLDKLSYNSIKTQIIASINEVCKGIRNL
ncbi:Mdm20p Ecym_5316 [Eremothecium cymbalariae DBVPG|uniref:Uncharacterized protein n=1 Tax=Eremothecium cymbalariae (strain CBS 270.75 / DBVPG 7215 / KCTC 17166 / NRRL Y-17582) TaxID=931890 RepID=I6NDD5_ERECY|nr:hypothetical protein Ecym_5316 [Eremothecium cymbalariae DBVPG\